MRRRTLLTSVASLTTVSGCTNVLGGGGSCGPGETEITDIPRQGDDKHYCVTGEVVEIDRGDKNFFVDDGTGVANVATKDGYHAAQTNLAEGWCVEVCGFSGGIIGSGETSAYLTSGTWERV